MSAEIDAWLKAGRHLPAPLRDFHDQKAVFAAMHALQDGGGPTRAADSLFEVSQVAGQAYTIDRVLWFLAKRGWTLQRSRADLPFSDLQADVEAVRAARIAAFRSHLKASETDGQA